jgi:predicted DNA-binding ribbon-helix-helix protein
MVGQGRAPANETAAVEGRGLNTVTNEIRHAEAVYDALEEFRGRLVSRSIRIGEQRTSVRLTCFTWRLLHEIAQRAGVTVHDICSTIHSEKPRGIRRNSYCRSALLPRGPAAAQTGVAERVTSTVERRRDSQDGPTHHWRSYGDDPLPTPEEALAAAARGLPVVVPAHGVQQMRARPGGGTRRLTDILRRMRYDGCGGLAVVRRSSPCRWIVTSCHCV